MNPSQEAIYHNLLLAANTLYKLPIHEQQEVLQAFVNRVNVRIQMKVEQVPFLERVNKDGKNS
jgi:hypothetical protein